MIGGCVVQAPEVERPLRHTAGGVVQAPPALTPSVVECMGRTTSIAFSGDNGDILVGVDVSTPQRWNEPSASFRGFAAGGGSNGTIIDYKHKKVVNEGTCIVAPPTTTTTTTTTPTTSTTTTTLYGSPSRAFIDRVLGLLD